MHQQDVICPYNLCVPAHHKCKCVHVCVCVRMYIYLCIHEVEAKGAKEQFSW